MPNEFLTYREEPGPPPSRTVYARLSQTETAGDVSLQYLEAIDRGWLNDNMTKAANDVRALEEAPVSVIEINPEQESTIVLPNLPKFDEGEPADESPWYEIDLVDAPGDGVLGSVLHYGNLFLAPVRRWIRRLQEVPEQLATDIEGTVSLTPIPDATAGDIQNALAGVGTINGLAVYDVGQGNCNAALNLNQPRLYFDLGGGIMGHIGTFPAAMANLCFAQANTIVLSHWDWDHWSMGLRFRAHLPQPTSMTWIAPRQRLGHVHASVAASILRDGGMLLLWPNARVAGTITYVTPHVTQGQITLRKCVGRGRNHSGIAMEIADTGRSPPLLLTGDARYSVIPSALTTAYQAVVLPHHGADMRNRLVPVCAGGVQARCAYSYGHPNTFGHPTALARTTHQARHWTHGHGGMDRATANRTAAGLGHIGIYWNPAANVAMTCGPGHCSLNIQQA
jgi:hypothetical protein